MKEIFVSILVLASALVGCAPAAVKRHTVGVKPGPRGLHAEPLELLPDHGKMDRRAYHFYVNGLLYEQMGHAYLAATNYRKAFQYFPQSYEIGYSLASNLYLLQEYSEGLDVLRQLNPQDAAVWELRAAYYRATGADDSARSAYVKVVMLDSTNSNIYSLLAGVYRQMDDLDSTIWAYQHLVRIRHEYYRLWTELGRLQAQKGDYQAAQEAFRSSIELQPTADNIHAYLGMAHCLELGGLVDSAIAVLRVAVDIDDDNVLVHRALRSLYISRDSLGSALPHARREVELTPLDRSAVRRLAILYYWLDSLQQSDSLFTFLVEAGDQDPANYSFLGRIAMRNDDFARAVGEFTLLTQVADSLDESWLDLAFVYQQMGELDEEINTYRTALNHMRDEDSQLRILFGLGAAYERQGKITESVATFEEVIARNPDFDQALNYLGYMLADQGERLDYARELIERAVELAPENAAYLDSYGWVLYRLGDYRKALFHLKKAVSLDSDPVMFDHLGDVYEAIGENRQARTWWEKALELDPDNQEIKSKLEP